ncbi:MAG: hypothetical protein ACREF3_18550 [Acetobacteraceae bacterium]
MASEGWKFHIAVAGAADAQRVLTEVTNKVLYPMEAAHKHWPTDDPIGVTDDNGGKWFAIYPASILNAFVIAAAIDDCLAALSVVPPGDGAIPHELKVGRGFVYTRYGSYSYKAVKGPTGFVADDRQAIKPAWVGNPWSNYVGSGTGTFDPAWTDRFPSYRSREVPRTFL